MSFLRLPLNEALQNSIPTPNDPLGVQKKFLSPAELSMMTGISTKTLEKWRRTGNGPTYNRMSPRTIRYNLEIFLAWMKARERRSTSDIQGGE